MSDGDSQEEVPQHRDDDYQDIQKEASQFSAEQTAVIEQMMAKAVEKALGVTKEHDKGKGGPSAVVKE